MSQDHTQEALDEYYSTGIDPTGGDIGPDEIVQLEYESSEEEKPQEPLSGLDRLEELVDAKLAELDRQKNGDSV